MQAFHILYFRQSILKRAEIAEGDLLDVIDQATENRLGERAEIWSEEHRKVGMVEPLPRQASGFVAAPTGDPAAEITIEMKQRLNLVRRSQGIASAG